MTVPFVKNLFYEFEFISQRSRGPGGQNVNKTNSSIQLRWNYLDSQQLSEEQKATIGKKLGAMINTENILYLRSDTHRDQEMNKKEVLQRLQQALIKAFHKPKTRKATKPTKSSQRKRVETKRHKSEIKKGRQGKWD
jgi:ribosome-associated protein